MMLTTWPASYNAHAMPRRIAPGGFQTGVNPFDFLGNEPIQEMAPSIK